MKADAEKELEKCPFHDGFVKAVLHRCVDLEWNDSRLCQEAKIAKSSWSDIRHHKKSPTMETMVKIARAVGIEWSITLTPGCP